MTDQELGVASTAKSGRPQPSQGVSHTPGPWRTEFSFGHRTVVMGPQRFPICNTHTAPLGETNFRREEANAQMIAAAPDMLEALETLAGRLCGDTMSDQNRRDAYEIADAAIAKALGQ